MRSVVQHNLSFAFLLQIWLWNEITHHPYVAWWWSAWSGLGSQGHRGQCSGFLLRMAPHQQYQEHGADKDLQKIRRNKLHLLNQCLVCQYWLVCCSSLWSSKKHFLSVFIFCGIPNVCLMGYVDNTNLDQRTHSFLSSFVYKWPRSVINHLMTTSDSRWWQWELYSQMCVSALGLYMSRSN